MNMRLLVMRFARFVVPLVMLYLSAAGPVAAQIYRGFPYTIMAPTHGTAAHRRAATSERTARSRHHRRRNFAVARGSSGSVLPTPLPRTPLIPPESGGAAGAHVAPQEQAPTGVPGLADPVPNLPHGAETFQDRASRCAMQQGLYGVPGGASTQYMGACVQ